MSVLSADQELNFRRDGFVIVDNVIDPSLLSVLHERFDRLFAGNFETGIAPDEVNWQEGEGDPTLTRQICNGWKADTCIASSVLNPAIAESIAGLAGWPGARLIQDNLLWKPPAARSVGFHRDNAYLPWYTPREMFTCWIALDDTTASGGTIEYAKGSHQWPTENDPESTFHAPDDYRAAVRAAASRYGKELQMRAIEVPAGSASFHHGWTWHGSGTNTAERERRALVVHLASSEARFDRSGFEQGTGPVYSRFAHADSDEMDEAQFPILWRRDGYRSLR